MSSECSVGGVAIATFEHLRQAIREVSAFQQSEPWVTGHRNQSSGEGCSRTWALPLVYVHMLGVLLRGHCVRQEQ